MSYGPKLNWESSGVNCERIQNEYGPVLSPPIWGGRSEMSVLTPTEPYLETSVPPQVSAAYSPFWLLYMFNTAYAWFSSSLYKG